MALRLARSMREGHKVIWLIASRLKVKGMGIQLPCLINEGEWLGRRGWLEYAGELEKRAAKLRSKLHGDLRQQMKKQKAGREVKLTRMIGPTSVEGGGREGAALANGLRKRRDGTIDNVVIREEGAEAGGPHGARAAASGEEVKASTPGYLQRWMGWDTAQTQVVWRLTSQRVGCYGLRVMATSSTRTVSEAGGSGGGWWKAHS